MDEGPGLPLARIFEEFLHKKKDQPREQVPKDRKQHEKGGWREIAPAAAVFFGKSRPHLGRPASSKCRFRAPSVRPRVRNR